MLLLANTSEGVDVREANLSKKASKSDILLRGSGKFMSETAEFTGGA